MILFKKKKYSGSDMLWMMYVVNREMRTNERKRKWA